MAASKDSGSMILGMLICWLLNLAQLGIAFLLLATSDKTLSTFYVLVFAIGLVQIGYVIPLYRFLRRNGKPRAAQGLIIAAGITAIVNAALVHRVLPFPR